MKFDKPISITSDHLEIFGEHKSRIVRQSGINGTPHYNPFNREMLEEFFWDKEEAQIAFTKDLQTTGWRRSWGILQDERIIGSIDLNGSRIPTGLHRALLVMGLEKDFRSKGLGTLLVETALAWARSTDLEWIDLGVFTDNIPAQKLYSKFGFKETGQVEDRFRVDGYSITDIQMSLKL